MAAKGSTSVSRKQLILSALCKHFSLDPKSLPENIAGDEITSLYSTVLKSAKNGAAAQVNDGVVNWVGYAEGFPTDSQACSAALEGLNETLADVSVILGNGFTPSEADAVVFSAVHSSVIGLSNTDRQKLPHLLRWVDYIQNKVDFGDVLEKIVVEKDIFDFRELDDLLGAKSAGKMEIDSNAKKTVQSTKTADKPGADLNTKKSDAGVLCASSEDHTLVEPLLPPQGAKPGERVSFSGVDGKPEDVLNPKKKQLDKITPNLFTDDKGVATFRGIPFMTSAGPCTSSIPKGTIK